MAALQQVLLRHDAQPLAAFTGWINPVFALNNEEAVTPYFSFNTMIHVVSSLELSGWKWQYDSSTSVFTVWPPPGRDGMEFTIRKQRIDGLIVWRYPSMFWSVIGMSVGGH